jgi:phospholipase/lecithinase/hemolysin
MSNSTGTLIFFGDSLFDTGNLDILLEQEVGGSAFDFPYSDGKATNGRNGRVISEYLAQNLGGGDDDDDDDDDDDNSLATRLEVAENPLLDDDYEAINYSFTGAESDEFTFPIPELGGVQLPVGFQSQIDLYLDDLADASFPEEKYTYFINIGSNDVFSVLEDPSLVGQLLTNPTATEEIVGEIVGNIAEGITILDANDGAFSTFVVSGLAPLGETPLAREIGSPITDLLTGIADAVNDQLVGLIENIDTSPLADAFYIDTFSIFFELKDSGIFKNTTEAFFNPDTGKLAGPLNRANRYIFFDDVHPTDRFNQEAANLAIRDLKNQGFGTTISTEDSIEEIVSGTVNVTMDALAA